MSYVGNFMTDVCFQYDGNGPIIRERFNFGKFPIMLMVGGCIFFVALSFTIGSRKRKNCSVNLASDSLSSFKANVSPCWTSSLLSNVFT